MLRVKAVRLTDFVGFGENEFAFNEGMNHLSIFGKSTLVDAISVALTGKARDGRERDTLARGPEGDFKVEVDLDVDGNFVFCRATRESQEPRLADLVDSLGPPSLLSCVVDWEHWSHMKPKDRKELLYKMSGGGEWRDKSLMGEIESTRKARGITAALEQAKEGRKRYEKAISDLKGLEKPKKPCDTPQKELVARLWSLRKEKNRASQRLVAVSPLTDTGQDRRESLVEVVKLAQTSRVHATEVKIKADNVALTVEGCAEDLRAAKESMDKLRAHKSSISTAVGLGTECPACLRPVTGRMKKKWERGLVVVGSDIDLAQAAFDSMEMAYDVAQDEYKCLFMELRSVEADIKRGESAKNEIGSLDKLSDAARDSGLDPAAIDTEYRLLCAEVDEVNEAIRKYGVYQAEFEAYEEREAVIKRHEEHLKDFSLDEEVIEKALRSGYSDAQSLMRQTISRAGKWLDEKISWEDNTLLPSLDGTPFANLSRTEKMTLSILIQYGLAKTSGLKFMVVDDIDLLGPGGRDVFKWLRDEVCVEDFQVITLGAEQSNGG